MRLNEIRLQGVSAALADYGVKTASAPVYASSNSNRGSAIESAFRNTAAQGNPSFGDPGAVNPVIDNSPANLRTFSTDTSGGLKSAAAGFLPIPPPSPIPIKPLTPPQNLGAKPPVLEAPGTPKPPKFQLPQASSAVTMSQNASGVSAAKALNEPSKLVNEAQKAAGFNYKLTPEPKEAPGEIKPDNGTRRTDDDTRPLQNRSVGRAFDSMATQKNQDFINASNEGSLGFPGV